jgi:arylformamidase
LAGFTSLVVDLSAPLGPETPRYPGDPPVIVSRRSCVEVDGYYTSLVVMGDHSGTHVDAPAHFYSGGATVERLPASKLYARGVALDFTWKGELEPVTREELLDALRGVGVEPGPGWYVLLAFGWDSVGGEAWLRHPYLAVDAAGLLADMGVEGVGVDTPSPDHPPDYPVHRLLLGRGIVIVENLRGLRRLAGRVFRLVVAPIPLVGASGAPARVLAILGEGG